MEKSKVFLIALTVLVVGALGGYYVSQGWGSKSIDNSGMGLGSGSGKSMNNQSAQKNNQGQNAKGSVNKNNCVADDCLAVDGLEYPAGQLSEEAKKALIEAINDEYKAHSVYEKTMAKLGNVRPFSMIIRAEESHIASLKGLFDKYSVAIPANDWLTKVQSEATLEAACKVGVEAEIENAKLYEDKLLPAVKDYADITQVFTNLMNASQDKHLPAFERCAR